MHFYLTINIDEPSLCVAELRSIDSSIDPSPADNTIVITNMQTHDTIKCVSHNGVTAWFLGDPITGGISDEMLNNLVGARKTGELAKSVNGHYRLIMLDHQSCELEVTSSLFSILPVYYCRGTRRIFVSDDLEWLAGKADQSTINNRFIVESILFYYPLFNETIHTNISLLPSHHSMIIGISGIIRLVKHTDISTWFETSTRTWKKDTEELAELFIDRVRHYLPDTRYVHALTGGFDSRTLVSCALYHRKNFFTYGFGNDISDDTQIAQKLAVKANKTFRRVDLGDEYISGHSLNNGLEFILHSNGYAGFARAHYLHACKLLSKETKTLVTGNFGSEIFRAAHNAGAMISPNLYHIFNSSSHEEAIRKIEQSPEFKLLNRDHIKSDWHSIAGQLHHVKDFSASLTGYDLNRSFYRFVFEEIFRKYFGPEMVNQYRFLNNRTPFLDADFLQKALRSGSAGVSSNFFENNPLKRYKGQVLYAHIIQKTFPPFARMLTGKGYKPADLLSWPGKLNITAQYLRKKLFNNNLDADPNSVTEAFEHNLPYFEKLPVDPDIFDVNRIRGILDTGPHDHSFLIAMSQAWYLNKVTGSQPKLHPVISPVHSRLNQSESEVAQKSASS